ncbi:MAG: ABC transporter ATP-binding protein [Desulfobacterales bacterium]|nr:MAG: ABC transporter ATP-binding protein [Desulfobacterales bacterium]
MNTSCVKKNKHSLYLVKRVGTYFLQYKFRIFLSLVSTLLVAACTAATAFLVKPALDNIFINKDTTSLIYIPIMLIALFALKGLFMFLQKYEMNYCGLKVLEQLRNELYAKIIYLPTSFFNESQVGMLMSRIVSDVELIRHSMPEFIRMVRQAITMLGLIGLVIYRDPYLAFWALLVLPLTAWPFIFFGKKLRKIGRKNQQQIASITAILQESLSGLSVVKAFATERQECTQFKETNGELVRIAVKGVRYNEMSSPIMELIGAVGMGLVIWYGGSQVIAGTSTPGTFFSFMTGLIMLYEPFKSINSANIYIQQALAGAERVFDILDSTAIQVETQGDVVYDHYFHSLCLDHVTFVYPGATTPALRDVHLTIHAGEKIALVGSSGAGKTTLAGLIPRLHEPTSGTILLNGTPLPDFTLESLRTGIGVVSQDAFLFNASIADNIAYGQTNATPEQIQQAAQAAYAHEFITDLPQGYATLVGERGTKLSGGQKQRITIARALLKNPSLLILDEATSALDTEAEAIVQKALDNLMRDRSSIVIAHRLSTIVASDRIIVMEHGRIIDEGKHEALLQRCSLYKKLYTIQFADH